MSDDDQLFLDFCQSAAAFLETALVYARDDNPALYRDVEQLVADGRAKPQLVVEFRPKLTASLRLVATESGRTIADVFEYRARPGDPKPSLN